MQINIGDSSFMNLKLSRIRFLKIIAALVLFSITAASYSSDLLDNSYPDANIMSDCNILITNESLISMIGTQLKDVNNNFKALYPIVSKFLIQTYLMQKAATIEEDKQGKYIQVLEISDHYK